jgi:uncharacterized protein YtpQ (UPF0354 family)
MNQIRIYQTPAEFGQTAAQVLAVQPGVDVLSVNDLTLDLRVAGRSVQADLHSFYRVYRDAPEQQPAIMQELVQSLTHVPPDLGETDPAGLLGRVMPMIKPLAMLNDVYERQLPMLAYRPLAADLMTAYVIDRGQSVAYINQQHLEAWGVTEATLHERALANLRAKDWMPYPGMLGAGKGALLIFSSRDGYDATRILVSELFADFAAQLPGNLVIGVPNRDFLIAFSDADRRVFAQIKAQIDVDVRTQPHPLTTYLFTLHAQQLQVYTS